MQVSWFLSAKDFPLYFQDFVKYGQKQRDMNPSVSMVVGQLEQLSIRQERRIKNVTDLYHSNKLRHEHKEVYDEMMSWLRKTPHQRADDTLNILLSMIMLFQTDTSMHLEDRTSVERVQNTFIKVAHRYIKTVYPKDSGLRFQEGMRMVQTVKRFNEINTKRLEDFSFAPHV